MAATDQQGEGLFNRGRTTGPDTGGGDIGHWSQVGGGIPGLKTVSAGAADLAPALAVGAMKRAAAKDSNDQPVSTTAGSVGGQKVEDVTGMPAPSTAGLSGGIPDWM